MAGIAVLQGRANLQDLFPGLHVGPAPAANRSVPGPSAPTAPTPWATRGAAGVAYLFAGSRGGVLDPAILIALPQEVTPVFHQDGVWIFALRPGS